MENYRGIYFNNANNPKFYEGGAHFKYKDLYNKLMEIYNKKNNIYFRKKKLSVLIFSPFKNYNINCNHKMTDKNIILKKGNSSTNRQKKTRNKTITNNYIDSESLDNNYKEINLNIFKKSRDKSIDNKIYNQQNYIKNTTGRLLNDKKKKPNAHNNSINENFNKNYKNNIYVVNKNKQNITNIKYNQINKSINKKKNYSNKNTTNKNTIYNYSYLNKENNYYKRFNKIKTNNNNNKSIFNIGIYKYNIYDNIFLKNNIKNKLKKYKYNSFVKENSISKNSVSSTKNKEKSKNKYVGSYDKNINGKNTTKAKNHITSINYTSMYLGINNNNKTPNNNIKNIFDNKSKSKFNENIYKIKSLLNRHYNKKKADYLKNEIAKNQNSYAKIKKNQLSLTKRLHNKKIIIKERLKGILN